MKHIYLGLAIHNHQPLGNFPWVFDDACEKAYFPMLRALQQHPSIRVSLHYSGCLIDWLLSERPEFFDVLKELVARGQVEIIGGGYYEPVLAAIPDADKTGQLNKLSAFIEKEFGARPEGMWLAERVWEPHLAGVIAECGLKWTLVDDTAFRMVGLEEKGLVGYFRTEEQVRYLNIFPISKYLRYSIPWHRVEKVIAHLEAQSTEDGKGIAVLGDDGEKFGIWPKTFSHCWENGWIDDFFKAIEDNSDWLSTIRLGDYIKQHPPTGQVYLPCASYDEMMEWSLPAEKSWELTELKHQLAYEGQDSLLQYMQGGYWRNFLVKYPEINRMYKKMLLVHDKVYRARAMSEAECGLDSLWRAQCNCPYWHGVFGCIYLSDIRATAYANLIRAENEADKVQRGVKGYLKCQETDFDGDGSDELLVEGEKYNLYISPAEGGSLFEWDLRERAFNVLSSVARRMEGYHHALLEASPAGETESRAEIPSIHDLIRVKDSDCLEYLNYDRFPRNSLIYHFFSGDTTLEDIEKSRYAEPGDFAGAPYQRRINYVNGGLEIVLKRAATVRQGDNDIELTVEKAIRLERDKDELDIGYLLRNEGAGPISLVFGSEWNVNLLGGGHNEAALYNFEGDDTADRCLDSRGGVTCSRLTLSNTQLDICMELKLDRPLMIWHYPVETISNSEAGVERIYQCSCLLILLPLELPPGQIVQLHYTWRVK